MKPLKTMNYFLLFITLISFVGCDFVEYNPNEIRVDSDDKHTLSKHIEELNKVNSKNDTIRFAVIGDTQRWYDETIACKDQINLLNNIDFVIQTGDLTDFGLPQEFKWMKQILDELHVPYFPVVGNHDLVANGGALYQEMFGVYDYSFVYKSTKFVFLNTNSLEFGFDAPVPNVNWLAKQLENSNEFENIYLVMHVPPMSHEFNPEIEEEFHHILNGTDNLIGVVHGHTHNFQITDDYLERVPLIGADATEKRTFLVYTIIGNEISYEIIPF